MKRLSLLLIACVMAGCTHNAARLSKTEAKLVERARENVTIAAIAGQRIPFEKRTPESDLAVEAVHRAQGLLGLPIRSQDQFVDELLTTNAALRAAARSAWSRQMEQEAIWKAKEAAYQRQLTEWGAKYEEERNKTIWKRIKLALLGTFGVGGLVALCVFCPVAIPVLGRCFGFVANQFPSLAGLLGVVSTGAFDSTFKGIERAKAQLSPDALLLLETHLSKSMDATHKVLVRNRRASIRE